MGGSTAAAAAAALRALPTLTLASLLRSASSPGLCPGRLRALFLRPILTFAGLRGNGPHAALERPQPPEQAEPTSSEFLLGLGRGR